MPLFKLLGGLEIRDFAIHIIRSRQIAPGLGGYRVKDMIQLLEKVRKGKARKWLIGTACRCHGVLNALELHP